MHQLSSSKESTPPGPQLEAGWKRTHSWQERIGRESFPPFSDKENIPFGSRCMVSKTDSAEVAYVRWLPTQKLNVERLFVIVMHCSLLFVGLLAYSLSAMYDCLAVPHNIQWIAFLGRTKFGSWLHSLFVNGVRFHAYITRRSPPPLAPPNQSPLQEMSSFGFSFSFFISGRCFPASQDIHDTWLNVCSVVKAAHTKFKLTRSRTCRAVETYNVRVIAFKLYGISKNSLW